MRQNYYPLDTQPFSKLARYVSCAGADPAILKRRGPDK